MKIERISENQIKCTLSRSDLASRQIRISELAYGTEKTKGLFHDMMEQAEEEFGFEVNDAPLMIEAIPISMESIVLMITKVDDPDDINPEFAKFSNFNNSSDDDDLSFLDGLDKDLGEKILSDIDDLLKGNDQPQAKKPALQPQRDTSVVEKIFSFDNLDSVIDFSHQVKGRYDGKNSLYKCRDNGRYFLHMEKSQHSIKDFVSICDSALEYGKREQLSYARTSFIKEHCDLISENMATQTLGKI